MSSFQQSQQQQAALSPPLARSTAKALDLAVVLNQSPGGSGEGVSPTSATYSENGEVVGPPGKMKEGRLNAGQAETTGVHCISQHTQQSHTSLPWPLFFLCLKCSSTVILLTNTCVAFKSQITCHLLFATFFVCKITPSLELFLYLIPISIIIRLNWIFFRTINYNYTSNIYSLLKIQRVISLKEWPMDCHQTLNCLLQSSISTEIESKSKTCFGNLIELYVC